MPLIALKAHYDGHAVIFDEPFDLPPETPLLVVVNPQNTSGQPSEKANRALAFQAAFGALRGKLSGSDEFMARKTEEKALEERIRL
ncbi:MAG: hypothetical protein WCS87_06745 [Methylococcaceae bacterium]